MRATAVAAVAVIATTGITGLTAGCDVQQAVDCARIAVDLTGNLNDLQQAVDAGDGDAFETALNDLDQNVEELHGVDDADAEQAGDSVAAAVDSIRASGGGEGGGEIQVDLAPLGDAISALSGVCSG
ncbi:hypothetical protein [Streptomyces hainanensis]|uniref:Secreted protein n=1 Tax=Streptomyces hainanensis TaxID=402648 RepID=A0A4R4T7M8_9ACTN|nr:hypothetical protein [Streptomyces hainanensis]TDC71012.1 hypothetical protein E1283_24025 [Streptomyces hainanensis]